MTDTQPLPTFAISIGGAKKAVVAANPLKRPHASLFEDEEDEEHNKKVQSVTHFDQKAGGAIDESKPKAKGPLIITPQSNRDWKEAGRQRRRRQQSALPRHGDQDQRIASIEAAEKRERDRSYGLNIMRSAATTRDTVEVINEAEPEPEPDPEPEAIRERTEDERAMNALLGVNQESSLVVPAISEDDAYQQDSRSAPDGPTLDDYARVPVEEYGAAMLRGMGWKGGKTKTAKVPERRPAMLGVGAKSDAAISSELGGWGKSARGKEPVIYNPVMLKDPKTGQLFTDAELQKKQEQDQRRKYEEEFENQERDKERRTRRHDDDDDRDRRDRRQRSDNDRSDRRRTQRDRSRNHVQRHRSERSRSRDHGDRHRSGRDRSRERLRDKQYDSKERRRDDRHYSDHDRSKDTRRDHRDRH